MDDNKIEARRAACREYYARNAERIKQQKRDRAASLEMAGYEPASHKTCGRCKVKLPIDTFHICRAKRDGHQGICKSCTKEVSEGRKERTAEINREWYRRNKAHRLDMGRKWVEENREMRIKQQRKYRSENADAIRATIKRCIGKNPDKYRAIQARWNEANPGKRNEIAKRYREAHPGKVAADRQNRRSRLNGAEGRHTAKDIAEILHLQRGRCAHKWCQRNLKRAMHVDHILPLALGGSNGRINIQLLCPKCNLKKSAKHPIDFAQKNGMLL